MEKPKAIFCWSGGKDSAYCLHKVLTEQLYDVQYLLTTLNETHKRISMHGVREELLDQQIKSIGIPLLKVWVKEGSNKEYEQQMEQTLQKAKSEGIKHVIFGDIFLEDLRIYREQNIEKIGMTAIFPLWKMNTSLLINDFISKKFKTITCCINDGTLNQDWVGKNIDQNFISELPEGVDPCGENGEYHTFCYHGPLFKEPIHFSIGEKIYQPIDIKLAEKCPSSSESKTKGFWFSELIPN